MTLFYLKWEEFFGAWLEKHGQSILIVYGKNSWRCCAERSKPLAAAATGGLRVVCIHLVPVEFNSTFRSLQKLRSEISVRSFLLFRTKTVLTLVST